MPLLRRLSSSFKKNKQGHTNGTTNGRLTPVEESRTTETNGIGPGNTVAQSLAKTKDIQRKGSHTQSTPSPPVEPAPSNVDGPASRKDVEDVFQQFAQLIHASQRPLPTQSGDGQYLEKQESSGFLADLKSLGFKDVKAVAHMLEDKASGQPQDDRKMHMEEIMQLIAALPDRSARRVQLTGTLLDVLWNSLQHPPMSYLGDAFRYRSADGSNNSYIFPQLGAANTPYARSVSPVTVQPGALPDPGLLFDSLMARDEFKPHPNKVSSIFFNWASLIIHGVYMYVDPNWLLTPLQTSSKPITRTTVSARRLVTSIYPYSTEILKLTRTT